MGVANVIVVSYVAFQTTQHKGYEGTETMWTHDNTEGFTDADLAIINSVLSRVFADTPDGFDVSNINDAITNNWRDGITAADLEMATRQSLGVA